ncbi:O-methyltransferase [Acidaminobacter sp.]|uniref:O-methyltransferase n=1 Tax=Acidaminobacter sp. TaxID=1872102 RepID=UPI00138376C4|nr:O-methyltransferase [Acidaminobacter sp.]MDK9712371.1 O-methyltransferase [Acidaminobacter sp.]MZQ97613.1 methyltransferase domain-containing protein [Acidaminobacter sp.]
MNPALVAALQTLTPTHDPFLKSLEAYAAEHRVPILQPESAQLLELLTAMKKPKHVLEIGTAIGYSAVRMAIAMGEGKITTIEKSPEMLELAKTTFENAKTNVVFEQLEGDAAEVLKHLKPSDLYDLVFIDAAKSHYKTYFDLVTPMLAPGALVISDNVLFRGLIADDQPVDKRFKTIAKNLKAYLAYLMAHEDFITSLVPIGDGFAVSLSRK